MVFGYKEWFLVCAALGEGRQHVLLRKGGIAEGRGGFSFKHDSFYLFPSYFHEQASRLRFPDQIDGDPAGPQSLHDPLAREGMVVIRWFARIEASKVLDSWEQVLALEPFHIWNRELVRERFDYKDHLRLDCALVRIYQLPEPWSFPDSRSFGGCLSWLELPQPPEGHGQGMLPVLGEDQFADLKETVTGILG